MREKSRDEHQALETISQAQIWEGVARIIPRSPSARQSPALRGGAPASPTWPREPLGPRIFVARGGHRSCSMLLPYEKDEACEDVLALNVLTEAAEQGLACGTRAPLSSLQTDAPLRDKLAQDETKYPKASDQGFASDGGPRGLARALGRLALSARLHSRGLRNERAPQDAAEARRSSPGATRARASPRRCSSR